MVLCETWSTRSPVHPETFIIDNVDWFCAIKLYVTVINYVDQVFGLLCACNDYNAICIDELDPHRMLLPPSSDMMPMNQMNLQNMLMQAGLRMSGQQNGLTLQMLQAGSGGHVDLGASSTRFSPVNPTMMGHGDRTFRIADAPAAAPADQSPSTLAISHGKTQHTLERASIATLLPPTADTADRAAYVPPGDITLADSNPDDDHDSDGPIR